MQTKITRAYLEAYRGLYGNQPVIPAEVKKRKRPSRDEEIEQEKYHVWFETVMSPKGHRWFHVPNGGYRNAIQAAKFKRQGVKRGIPDIWVPISRSPYHGLIIELKRIDGKLSHLSDEQRDWISFLSQQGYSTHVAFGFEHTKKITEQYLK